MIEIKVDDKTYTLITLAHGEQREMTSQESAMVTQIMLTSMAANDHPFNGDAVDMFLSATERIASRLKESITCKKKSNASS